MNDTLKLPDDLCRAARHRAVDQSKSLSQWMTDLIRRELASRHDTTERPKCWMDAFSGDEDDLFLDRDLPLEDRKTTRHRDFTFDE